MRKIKLIIEYDGTNYVGWQRQPNGLSIQQVLEESLARLLGAPASLRGSGRTDAGVHARGMVAAFTTERRMPLSAFSDGMNSLLPPDIAIRDACEMPLDFDPRFDAKGKLYRYTISRAKRRTPLTRHYAWHFGNKLDLDMMRHAARHFIGEHDFAAFRASGCAAKTTVRRINSLDIRYDGEFITIDVIGTGFLRNMVRIMVGTLVAVGEGKLAPDAVRGLLTSGARGEAGMTAPPHGLTLMEVFY
jgi:tRNA pseudouridine38-40 synthase